ncbi:hypothetical protein, partial [Brachybacterium paraconglomeratum]|uniref:hypothetical protein n=1 Tax=Brachybacterium paraconglomeratum TaxID=173362 RepID=UPI0022AE5EA3
AHSVARTRDEAFLLLGREGQSRLGVPIIPGVEQSGTKRKTTWLNDHAPHSETEAQTTAIFHM